jgi:hypothetical protein
MGSIQIQGCMLLSFNRQKLEKTKSRFTRPRNNGTVSVEAPDYDPNGGLDHITTRGN